MLQENSGYGQQAYFLAFPIPGFPLANLGQPFYPPECTNYYNFSLFPSVCPSTSASLPTFATETAQQD